MNKQTNVRLSEEAKEKIKELRQRFAFLKSDAAAIEYALLSLGKPEASTKTAPTMPVPAQIKPVEGTGTVETSVSIKSQPKEEDFKELAIEYD